MRVHCSTSCLVVLFGFVIVGASNEEGPSLLDDLLLPYINRHGSTHHIRHIRSLQNPKYNYTYEMFAGNVSEQLLPAAMTRYFVSDVGLYYYDKVKAYGHLTTVMNPLRSFSVLEPREEGGCGRNITETVENSARQRKCLVSQNGGFFNTKYESCIGNIVSDGRLVQDSGGVQNANFGITKNGTIVTGYLSSEDITELDFKQLIGGAIWLVRNGQSYVEESFKCESSDVEETGTLRTFIDVQSARTAIGHDKFGRVILVNIEGQTRSRGVNLNQFAKLLIDEFHVVNAINLDGGGSATLVLNDTLVSYPSDHCKNDPEWRCARAVTTIVCVHELDCEPRCVHGECVDGSCSCHTNFRGDACDELYCGHHNCSSHGICEPDGCNCEDGWHGRDCTAPCSPGNYGKNCSQLCQCQNNGSCNSVNGTCECLSGFGGALCEKGCSLGTYGRNCEFLCHCTESCECDPATGICSNMSSLVSHNEPAASVAHCLAKREMRDQEEKDDKKDFIAYHGMAILCSTAGALVLSLAFNVYMLLVKFDYSGENCGHHDDDYDYIKEPANYIPLHSHTENGENPGLLRSSDFEIDNLETSVHNIPRSSRGQRTRPFTMEGHRKLRAKRKAWMPSWRNLVKNLKKSKRGGYQRLVPDEVEYEETSLLSEVR